jgi:hypothetical protein
VIDNRFDTLEHMFDVIVDEVKKYSPKARKLTTKAGKRIEPLDAITIPQFTTEL